MRKLLLIFLSCFSLSADYPYRFEGIFEEYYTHPLDLIDMFLDQKVVIFEAGGHYGDDTLRFSRKWPDSTIITFEPNPHAFQMLSDATKDLPNVSRFPYAVGDHNGTTILNVCYGTNGNEECYEGASSILEPSDGMKQHYQGPKVEVPCVILDDWCQENNIDHFDFLWLDLEGFELQALKSSPKILSKAKIIYTETNFQMFRLGMTQYHELKTFLLANGFQLLSHWYHEGLQGNAIFVRF